MAQRIVVECDQCIAAMYADTVPVSALAALGQSVTVSVTLPGRKARTWQVDLCEVHRKPFEDLGAELDELGGRPPEQRPGATRIRGGGTLACPECPKTFRSSSGLRTHLQTQHPEHPEVSGVHYRCTCGQGFSKSQGLGMHIARSKFGDHARADEA